jgi:hypothetical protein
MVSNNYNSIDRNKIQSGALMNVGLSTRRIEAAPAFDASRRAMPSSADAVGPHWITKHHNAVLEIRIDTSQPLMT